jgi:hypothetical protein
MPGSRGTGHHRKGFIIASPRADQRGDVPLFRWGVAKLVKAPDFDSGIRGFESFLPSHCFDEQPAARPDGGVPSAPFPR